MDTTTQAKSPKKQAKIYDPNWAGIEEYIEYEQQKRHVNLTDNQAVNAVLGMGLKSWRANRDEEVRATQ